MRPKVSIIMPSLNVANYIHECMESIIMQSLQEIEVICVDAGSTDGTLEILEEYAQKDRRISVIKSDKKSYGYQMNLGIKHASGEYIGILETDDFVNISMYETLYQISTKYNLDVIKADYYRFAGQGNKREKKYCNIMSDPQLYNKIIDPQKEPQSVSFSIICAGIYRLAFLLENEIRFNETPGASYQDNGFYFQTHCCAKRIYFLNTPFYWYRQDNPNSSINNKSKVFLICDEYEFIYNFFKKREDIYPYFIKRYSRELFYAYWTNFHRISDQYKSIFLDRFSNDLKALQKRGEYFPEVWSESNQKIANEIKAAPQTFYQKYMQKTIQSQELVDTIPPIIVSLTSWRERIHIVHQTILSLLEQSLKPQKILLYLSLQEFPDKEIPVTLLEMQNECFQIIFVKDDLKSHKKYFYSMQEYTDSIIITVDDDVFYNRDLVKLLVSFYLLYPHTISCLRGHTIKMLNSITFAPYLEWVKEKKITAIPSHLVIPTGVGGVLYPPNCLPKETFDSDKIKRLALYTDDLWLKYMELKAGIPCVLSNYVPWGEQLEGTESSALCINNVNENGNDHSWQSMCLEDNGLTYSGQLISKMLYNEYYEKFLDKNSPSSNETLSYIRLQRRCRELDNEINNIYGSETYRIGKIVTFVPLKIIGLIKCYREHGFMHTLHQIKVHLRRVSK